MTLREYLGKHANQTELAFRAGVSQPSLSNFLNGKRGLSARTMAKIVEATGGLVTYEDLVAEMEDHRKRQEI